MQGSSSPLHEIQYWRFGKIVERLLGGRTQWSPPLHWPCWIEPRPALPIDRCITLLRRSARQPRLRTRENLMAHGITCPFYGVRWAIGMAVDAATVAAQDDAAELAKRWHLHQQAAEQAAAAIATLARSLMTKPPVTRWPLLESSDIDGIHRNIFELYRRGGLPRIAAHARQARRVFLNNQGSAWDIWRTVFAADLGFTWRVLTGADPARTDPFISFVAAAFDSIAGQNEESWERPVRRALALGVDFGRYEKNRPTREAKT